MRDIQNQILSPKAASSARNGILVRLKRLTEFAVEERLRTSEERLKNAEWLAHLGQPDL
jgi:hypothetical protein